MSNTIRLAGALPGDAETNGLDALAKALVDDPDGTTVTAVVTFDVRKVEYSVAEGAHVPTVQVRRIEAWLTEDTPQPVRDAMIVQAEKRLNRPPLPFGVLEGDGNE